MATLNDVFEQLEKDIRGAIFYAKSDTEFKINGMNNSINEVFLFQQSLKNHLETKLLETKNKLEQYFNNPPNRTGYFDGELWQENYVELTPPTWEWDSEGDKWTPFENSTDDSYIITDVSGNQLKDNESGFKYDFFPKYGIPKIIIDIERIDVEVKQKNTTTFTINTWDSVTNNRIAKLDKRLQKPATNFINNVKIKLNIKLRIADGFRSIKEQNDLYAKGRTRPGKIVTNAKGGDSFHNYGLAIDVFMMKDNGEVDWSIISSEIVEIGKEEGFKWGGDWKSFKDYPHFEMTFGKTISDLKKSKK